MILFIFLAGLPSKAVVASESNSSPSVRCGEGVGDRRALPLSWDACFHCKGASLSFDPGAAGGNGYTFCRGRTRGKADIRRGPHTSAPAKRHPNAGRLPISDNVRRGLEKIVVSDGGHSNKASERITPPKIEPEASRQPNSKFGSAPPAKNRGSSLHPQQAVREMLSHVWRSYESGAMGHDELRPISCQKSNPFGGIGLFLIDSLTTLLIVGEQEAFRRAITWLMHRFRLPYRNLFNVDQRVHVFEVNIRVLGGLLSAHQLIVANPLLVPDYSNELLRLAESMGSRLVPAFETSTGIPLSWVNLRSGKIKGDTQDTCTACAGTLLLEFGTLSRLTGNRTYERLADIALHKLFERRNLQTGLPGSTLNTNGGFWTRRETSIGASVDSYYEYLLKSYLVFGDGKFLDSFATSYAAVMAQMRENITNDQYWLVDVFMQNAKTSTPFVSSLSAFWPGMQALIGHVHDAEGLFRSFQAALRKFKWLPELFDHRSHAAHAVQCGYPLRPEHIESAYWLYIAQGPNTSKTYVEEAARMQRALRGTRQRCGYANVQDVEKGDLSDRMESFFLSETCLYLWLIFAGESALIDYFVFTTEGHPLEIFAAAGNSFDTLPDIPEQIPAQCESLCNSSLQTVDELSRQAADSIALRNLGLRHDKLDFRRAILLRRRRCLVCIQVDVALDHRRSEAQAKRESQPPNLVHKSTGTHRGRDMHWERSGRRGRRGMRFSGSDAEAMTTIKPQAIGDAILCPLTRHSDGSFLCGRARVLSGVKTDMLNSLEPASVLLQSSTVQHEVVQIRRMAKGNALRDRGVAEVTTASDLKSPVIVGVATVPEVEKQQIIATAMPALFGPTLPDAGGAGSVAETGGSPVGPLRVAQPPQACKQLQNPPRSLQGAWVIADRGACPFVDKVLNAQEAGAFGVIVVNRDDETLIAMQGDGGVLERKIRIPAVVVTASTGASLRDELWRDGEVFVAIDGRSTVSTPQMRVLVPPRVLRWVQGLLQSGRLDWSKVFENLVGRGFFDSHASATGSSVFALRPKYAKEGKPMGEIIEIQQDSPINQDARKILDGLSKGSLDGAREALPRLPNEAALLTGARPTTSSNEESTASAAKVCNRISENDERIAKMFTRIKEATSALEGQSSIEDTKEFRSDQCVQ